MFFFANLGLAQFLVLFGGVAAISVVLYLLDRSRRRVVVSTLRFWVAAEQPTAVVRRKRIQQPLSLLLQLTSMLLLLLALSQLRLGSEAGLPRRHVLVLETSAWMNARTGRRTLMDAARARARAYLHALPSADLVMLVRADALATPATGFESNHAKVESAIAESEPSATSLNFDQAIEFARKVQGNTRQPGEIAFVGSGRIDPGEGGGGAAGNLRVLPVVDNVENAGLRKVGARRSPSDPSLWDIYVSARNYGTRPREVTLQLAFANMPAGAQRLVLAPGSDREAAFSYRAKSAGILQARIIPGDAFADDDRASVELPALQSLPLTVYSDQPELLRAFLAANPQVNALFRPVSQYDSAAKGLVILDRFRPPVRPAGDSIWIDPPPNNPPMPIRARVREPQSIHWAANHPLGSGLRARDVRIASTSVFSTAPGDIKVAETEGGAIIVARPGPPKTVVLGFHPALSGMRYELAAPLLFANIVRWMAPEAFRSRELSTQAVGTVNVNLESETAPGNVRVVREDGSPVPFTLEGKSLHFFSGTPGTVRVIEGDRESVYSLSLPEIGGARYQAPPGARHGLPALREASIRSRDIWQLLAILGAAGLMAEWLLYGRLAGRVRNVVAWPRRLRKVS